MVMTPTCEYAAEYGRACGELLLALRSGKARRGRTQLAPEAARAAENRAHGLLLYGFSDYTKSWLV